MSNLICHCCPLEADFCLGLRESLSTITVGHGTLGLCLRFSPFVSCLAPAVGLICVSYLDAVNLLLTEEAETETKKPLELSFCPLHHSGFRGPGQHPINQ